MTRKLSDIRPAYKALQFTLRTSTFHQSPAVAEDDLSMLNSGDEPHLLPSILESTGPPSLCDEFVSRFHRCSKPCLIFFNIGWVAGSQNFEEPMASCVPREQAMHDGASETHLLTWFRSSMEGIVVPIQSSKSVSNVKDQNQSLPCTYTNERTLLSFGACALHRAACPREEGNSQCLDLTLFNISSHPVFKGDVLLPLGPPQLPCPTKNPLPSALL